MIEFWIETKSTYLGNEINVKGSWNIFMVNNIFFFHNSMKLFPFPLLPYIFNAYMKFIDYDRCKTPCNFYTMICFWVHETNEGIPYVFMRECAIPMKINNNRKPLFERTFFFKRDQWNGYYSYLEHIRGVHK